MTDVTNTVRTFRRELIWGLRVYNQIYPAWDSAILYSVKTNDSGCNYVKILTSKSESHSAPLGPCLKPSSITLYQNCGYSERQMCSVHDTHGAYVIIIIFCVGRICYSNYVTGTPVGNEKREVPAPQNIGDKLFRSRPLRPVVSKEIVM
jgi:hypothetical protein